MRNFLTTILFMAVAQFAVANEGGPKLMNADVDLSDRASLQRGAKMFVNYCAGCHSAAYLRYNRIAQDLGIPEDLMKSNLMFTTDKIGEPILTGMRPADSEAWFGVTPPDLSVSARSRGTDWLYSYLNGFYVDPKTKTGVNNLYFPGAAMPHVLWELEGLKRAVFKTETTHEGTSVEVFERFEQQTPGRLKEHEYRRATRDLVAFLDYMGEPAKLVRYALGAKVIFFLMIFFVSAYLLKREYWKDVH